MVRIFERYLQDIGREPLLTPAEEIRLAARARAGDRRARHRLASANLRFVVSVARRYQGHGVPLADLVEEGNLGLLRAVERFDETRGVRFVSYAHWWVRRAIVEAIDRHRGTPREGGGGPTLSLDEPLASESGGTLQDVLADPRGNESERRVMHASLRAVVERCLADLPAREAGVLRRYFGLREGGPEDLATIGRALGVSRERVRQLRDRGLARLRVQASRHDLRSFGRRPDVRRPESGFAARRAGKRPIDFAGDRE